SASRLGPVSRLSRASNRVVRRFAIQFFPDQRSLLRMGLGSRKALYAAVRLAVASQTAATAKSAAAASGEQVSPQARKGSRRQSHLRAPCPGSERPVYPIHGKREPGR